MRICFDGQGLGGNRTGAGKAFECLLRQLRRDFPEHDYHVLAPPAGGSGRLRNQLLWEQLRFPRLARRRGADLLHAPIGRSAPIVRGRRLVMTLHDVAPTRRPDLLPSARSRWYWGRWIPFTARFADAVLVPSAATKRDLVEVVGVPAARVHVTPWALALEVPAPSPATQERVRRRYELPLRYLLYVGTIDRRKDYATLLEALRQLDPRVGLVLAGTVIRGRTDFLQRVARLGLAPRIRLLGYVPDPDLCALYRDAAVFVYPTFFEGFGLPCLEAMAFGTPVVSYRNTSLPEVVGDGGILLDTPWTAEALAAALRPLLDDEALRLEWRQRGLEHVKRFDWAETARLTMAVYEAVAGQVAPAVPGRVT